MQLGGVGGGEMINQVVIEIFVFVIFLPDILAKCISLNTLSHYLSIFLAWETIHPILLLLLMCRLFTVMHGM